MGLGNAAIRRRKRNAGDSALLGAAYLVAIDTLARTLTAAEIPLGVLTALIGAPVFAAILVRRQRQASR